MAAALLLGFGGFVVPGVAQPDLAVASNFERFDGLDIPADHPASDGADGDFTSTGAIYGIGTPDNTPGAVPVQVHPTGKYPRPGQLDDPPANGNQVYTPGPLRGLTNTLGGQPLKVADWKFRGERQYTPSRTSSIQHRLGDGQAYQGAAQTVQLSEITGSPPVPGDLSGIIAGQG
jgi:hypothetical protein